MDKEISVAVISEPVGKSPEEVTCSFVFDEVYRLAKKGINMHVIRSKIEGGSISYGIHFHGIEKLIDPQALNMLMKNIMLYPPISLLRNPIYLYWENLYASNVSKIIEKYNLDLIHAHFAYREGLVGLLAKRKRKKPLIVTIHGYDILIEPSVNFGIRRSMRYDALVRKVIRSSDALIVNSRAVYREVLKVEPQAKNKLYLIPLGVDCNRFNPNIDGLSIRRRLGIEDKFIIFVLKAHEPRYRIEDVIRAAAIVIHHYSNVVFLIGGTGSLKDYHQNLSRKLNISNNVIFLGKIPYDELPLYYAACDIFVNPALGEGFGIVIAEAMATGKPVVAVKRFGPVDLILDGVNGFLVKPMSPQEIADKIIYFVENSIIF